ncbi:hypothetical protein CTI12_AA030730 [Artemisia annua]|uniref:Uncharacterized protein n=1 Tax=Artemisia annua TaxID=35608 RepID=A0A2U1Q2I8_ARTAN|nr:hypothetical protein CTI12_AA030730 [Artemisia annua]
MALAIAMALAAEPAMVVANTTAELARLATMFIFEWAQMEYVTEQEISEKQTMALAIAMALAAEPAMVVANTTAELARLAAMFIFERAQMEYVKFGRRYEESLKVKPDFYEGYLALRLQQFEQAKLSWYYAIGKELYTNSGTLR